MVGRDCRVGLIFYLIENINMNASPAIVFFLIKLIQWLLPRYSCDPMAISALFMCALFIFNLSSGGFFFNWKKGIYAAFSIARFLFSLSQVSIGFHFFG